MSQNRPDGLDLICCKCVRLKALFERKQIILDALRRPRAVYGFPSFLNLGDNLTTHLK